MLCCRCCYAMSMLCWFHFDVMIALSCGVSRWRCFDVMLMPCWCHDYSMSFWRYDVVMLMSFRHCFDAILRLCWFNFIVMSFEVLVWVVSMLCWRFVDIVFLLCMLLLLFMLPRCYSDASLRVLRYWFELILCLFHVTLRLRRGYFELILVLTSGWCLMFMVFWGCCEVILRLLPRYFHVIWDAMLVLLYC